MKLNRKKIGTQKTCICLITDENIIGGSSHIEKKKRNFLFYMSVNIVGFGESNKYGTLISKSHSRHVLNTAGYCLCC